ncbi:primosomal protein DnaI [Limosilactobacillus coleohominis 101-4-CHN]|uniref:Primosomal protein DnaI n=1 Tax=Limosilactobacillus coleohominis 101-4-CHN TaxID=575594 RepID=C7XTH6_9LACO|nr:primosomal protein DnaI [Limosilactobacillus coleohominis]EEU31149.1 primosomal protein DnaI [Limosilactobacillus coleohominis 101-4-CHN]
MEPLRKLLKNQNSEKTTEQIFSEVFADQDVKAFLNTNRDRLTDEDIQRGRSKLYEYVHEKHLAQNGAPSVAPGYTPRLVMSAGQIDVTYVPTAQLLKQQALQAKQRRVSKRYMPKFIEHATLDDYYTNNEGRAAALNAAVKFVNGYSKGNFVPGIYLSGSFGVGKTYLLGAIANELADQGVNSMLIHFPTFAVNMKGSIARHTTEQERDEVKQAPILMLDDIGADALSPWLRDEVLGVILEYRMQEELPTFFSSNFSMDELTDHLAQDNNGNSEPLKAQRIMERIRFLSREVRMVGPNLRTKG